MYPSPLPTPMLLPRPRLRADPPSGPRGSGSRRPHMQDNINMLCNMQNNEAYIHTHDIILSVKTICLGSLILGIGTPLSRPSFMGMACGPRSVQRQITSKSQCEWVAW